MKRKKKAQTNVNIKLRFFLLSVGLLVGLSGLVWRVVYLTAVQRDFLQEQGEARSTRKIRLPAYRGVIEDRSGHPLAISSPVATIWAAPKSVALSNVQITALAKLLQLKPQRLKRVIESHKTRDFVYLKRQVSPEIATKIAALHYHGIYQQRVYQRFYPEGEMTAHIVGFTDVDDHGQEGLELAYDAILTGKPGFQRVVKDRLGHVIEVSDEVVAAEPGNDIRLSIDRHIQYIAYRELKRAMRETHAESASIVVLDVETGEVLAMVNLPTYNPNQRPKYTDSRYRNRAITDLFEPGSTIKPFTMTRVLMDGKVQPHDLIKTNPGWIVLDKQVVRDYRYLGDLDVSEVLQYSSNVGIAKLALGLPANALWTFYRNLGFGEITDSRFPGEAAGQLVKPHRWSDFGIATLSFGYGVSVTNLQLAQAYATLASGGIKHPIRFLKQSQSAQGKRIIPYRYAKQVQRMLENVVMTKNGTGKRARVSGYRAFGKTGTVRMLGKQGYDKNRHVGMFVGAIPASKPKVVISIVITDPKEQYYGGLIAAPVFASVAGDVMRALGIAPDDEHV